MTRLALALLAVLLWDPATSKAATLWTGAPVFFRQDPGSPTDVLIEGEVEITRDLFRGIYNSALEDEYADESPAGTEWAFASNNPAQEIRVERFAELQFDPWVEAITRDPISAIGEPAVLHLIESDIYLEIEFTEFGARGAGGFAYFRSTLPEPTAVGAGAALVGLLAIARSRRARVPRETDAAV